MHCRDELFMRYNILYIIMYIPIDKLMNMLKDVRADWVSNEKFISLH